MKLNYRRRRRRRLQSRDVYSLILYVVAVVGFSAFALEFVLRGKSPPWPFLFMLLAAAIGVWLEVANLNCEE